MALDRIIANARLSGWDTLVEIGIADGHIAEIAPTIVSDAPRENAGGAFAFGGFVEIDPRAGFRSFEALLEVQRTYASAIDIELCAFAQEGLTAPQPTSSCSTPRTRSPRCAPWLPPSPATNAG